ncbi:methyltransferase family protein [Pseudidiomarina halophila]|uniref:Isoprenylcysteine carboxylmethyltransferase family protein n=2 Tax=Pseudidiomarina halophila TaxID=1449799 RepID=A0A432XV50_9GAMM|nr:isoprenylcysteine carboxylmethyltransferase family protein [Pseudidiomarina halophila]RUO52606.1 isoprenylcysteine carboxylmethyltransferase family protein [Pseudidiomarina halophila]
MSQLELKIPPIIVVLLVALGMYTTAQVIDWPLAAYPQTASAIALLGLVLAVLGVWQFRKARTTVDPRKPEQSSAIVTGGIYRWTRNPMYLGFLLILIALALRMANLAVVPWLIVYVLYMNRFQIEPEERMLRAKFGKAYEAYLKRVRRWF